MFSLYDWSFAIDYRILFNHLGYSLITSSGVCKHVNGKFLTNCLPRITLAQISCEEFCTSQTSCVGYMFQASTRKCRLFPSESKCPSEFDLKLAQTLAASKNDLAATPVKGFVCYGKNSGKIFELYWQTFEDFEKLISKNRISICYKKAIKTICRSG